MRETSEASAIRPRINAPSLTCQHPGQLAGATIPMRQPGGFDSSGHLDRRHKPQMRYLHGRMYRRAIASELVAGCCPLRGTDSDDLEAHQFIPAGDPLLKPR